MKKIFPSLFFLISMSFLTWGDGSTINYFSIIENNEKNNFELSPVVFLGTHRSGIGINARGGLRFNKAVFSNSIISLGLNAHLYPFLYKHYFGIPGNSAQLNSGISITFTWGEKRKMVTNPWVTTDLATHTIGYTASYYFSSDNTSQPYGGIEYRLNMENSIFKVRLDNDDLFILLTDKYRSTYGKIEYLWLFDNNMLGANIMFHIWTGKLDGTQSSGHAELREETYALTGYGGEYSHGIISLSFIYNFLTFSIGYDSEKVRDLIQNGWHYFYNRPRVPLVDRDDRFYFQISIFNSEFQY